MNEYTEQARKIMEHYPSATRYIAVIVTLVLFLQIMELFR